MNKGFTVSQLSDVRTDDAGAHAVLGFVQGPGLSVLAIWTGTGLKLDGLAAADEFASQASNVPMGTPTPELKDLVGQTAKCYQALYAPKKDNKDNKKQ